MILGIHIAIAIASMVFTTHLYLSPQQSKFKVAYWLLGGTLASGTFLVIASSVNILKTCLTGIGYLAIVSLGIALARKKLAAENITLDQ